MSTHFTGRLLGSLADDVAAPLAHARVRVYRLQGDAPPADPARPLPPEAVQDKESRLIAEAQADGDGTFALELDEHPAVELDVRMAAPGGGEATQFTVARLDAAALREGRWEQRISPDVWKAIVGRGTRIIFGRITACGTQQGMAGLTVRAFDSDCIQDDALGQATTDAGGNYVIFYTAAQYKKTPLSPLVNVDTPLGAGGQQGPEVYFRIQGPAGTLLNEPGSRGRAADRANVPALFRADLCVTGEVRDPVRVDVDPMFLRVGQYKVNPVHNHFTPGGLTTAGEYAFTRSIPLEGNLPDATAAVAMEYRFLARAYANPDGTGALGPTIELNGTHLAQTQIGWLVYYDYHADTDSYVSESTPFYAGGAPAQVTVHRAAIHGGDVVVNVTTPIADDGWIQVPRINELHVGGRGRFEAWHKDMAVLNTAALTSQTIDLRNPAPAHQAGKPVPAGKRAAPRVFQLTFQARKVGTVPPGLTNVLDRISMINATFQYDVHPNWSGHAGDGRAVVSVNVKEAVDGGGCGKVSTLVNVLYTVYHPFIRTASLSFEGPVAVPGSTLAVGPDGHASSPDPIVPVDPAIPDDHVFDFSAKPNCAYVAWLGATLDLTSGYGRIIDAGITDHVGFCKG
ncbi:hypothetical protein [Longimicrobium sp.]|uniref:hypothetical protein n=1 Tax=Longimicrobium sp. TaxID=2029185 RepID=UPI002E37DFA7|nr:hypothetical protein [Longimicrobium sp.]HEX6039279.1 hypothetical protein [Longimicrobium sp.]